jgi:hypothetical protein
MLFTIILRAMRSLPRALAHLAIKFLSLHHDHKLHSLQSTLFEASLQAPQKYAENTPKNTIGIFQAVGL